jgi:hypothetical protein
MSRVISVLAVLFCLDASRLCAQAPPGTQFTVKSDSATVHMSPSTGSPEIGRAQRGTVLTVTREVGSWVKISWPAAKDGVGYIHVINGTTTHAVLAPLPAVTTTPVAMTVSSRPAPAPLAAAAATSTSTTTTAVTIVPRTRTAYVTPLTHVVGLGARVEGSTVGFGATGRGWSRTGLGIQVEAARSATNGAEAGRLTSVEVAPSALFAFGDYVSAFVWVRPYIGGGAGVVRQTLTAPAPGSAVSNSSLALQTFGGGEFTFASVPRFALSADVGYRWLRTPLAGYEPRKFSVALSGHWYVK